MPPMPSGVVGWGGRGRPPMPDGGDQNSAVMNDGGDQDSAAMQALIDAGVKFYGAGFCGWCTKQKAAHPLIINMYVDCEKGGCTTSDGQAVRAFPTWDFGNGKVEGGFKTKEQLAEVARSMRN